MNRNFNPSEEQQKIFNFFRTGIGNIVINAKAGSGKSTTIIEALNVIPKNKKVLLIAHNRDIVDHLKNKVNRDEKNTNIFTYHSLGYKIIEENIGKKPELDEYKYISYMHKNLEELSNGEIVKLTSNKAKRYRANIKSLLSYARYNKCQCVKEIISISRKYNVPIVANECAVVKLILDWGKKNTDIIDYTDMIWLPYELMYQTKFYKSDWVIVDEAQDTSPVQQELFKKCFKRGGRFALVGDEKQCINVWCGSDEEALSKFIKEPNTITLPLNTSFRCPKSIIKKSQEIVPDIKCPENAIEGEIRYETNPIDAVSGDMVLCRNLSPLAKLYAEYLKNGKKAFIRGTDISDDLINVVNSTECDIINLNMNEKGIISSLYLDLYELWCDTAQNYEIDMIDALNTNEVMTMYDKIKTIEALSFDINTKNELIERIKQIFIDQDGEGIILSSVHKAKGLEADNVYILCPSLIPSKLAEHDWEKRAEINLKYVAITRAKKTLNYVSERLFPTEVGFFANNQSMKTLLTIIKKITDNNFNNNNIK